MIVVELTPLQYAQAYNCGVKRDIQASKAGYNASHNHGFKGEAPTRHEFHVWGAAAEHAAAIAIHETWTASCGTYKEFPDVLPEWDVRRRSKWSYDVLVRPDDPDYIGGVTRECKIGDPSTGRRKFIHVVGTMLQYCVVGWIWTQDAKQPQYGAYHADRDFAFFVPKRYLTPIGQSIWHPENRIVDTSIEQCPRCKHSEKCVHVAGSHGWRRVDCSVCDTFVRFIT